MEDETVPERIEVEMLKVRGKVPFPFGRVRNVLVRSTNWIGDVVMTFPAIAAVRKTMPEARITALAKPWVAELLRLCPDVDEVMLFQSPGTHDGLSGKLRLAAELRARRFDAAILLQMRSRRRSSPVWPAYQSGRATIPTVEGFSLPTPWGGPGKSARYTRSTTTWK